MDWYCVTHHFKRAYNKPIILCFSRIKCGLLLCHSPVPLTYLIVCKQRLSVIFRPTPTHFLKFVYTRAAIRWALNELSGPFWIDFGHPCPTVWYWRPQILKFLVDVFRLWIISTESRNLVPHSDGCTNRCVEYIGKERGSQKTVRLSLLEL